MLYSSSLRLIKSPEYASYQFVGRHRRQTVSVLSHYCFFFSSRRRHTRCSRDWSSDVCSSDLRRKELRSCMILDARSSLRRWTTVTSSAKRVRKMASSKAESPPPTTAMRSPRKKDRKSVV